MKNEYAIKVLEEKIEELSVQANAREEAQQVAWLADNKIEKQEVEIWFRFNDGTLGQDKTVKVASATYENQSALDALTAIYNATQNDCDSWVDEAEKNELTLHVSARNEDGYSQGSSYVGDIIIINGDIYEVASFGFNKLDECYHVEAIEAFKNEVVFGRDDEERRRSSSIDTRARTAGWKSFAHQIESGVRDLKDAIRNLKED